MRLRSAELIQPNFFNNSGIRQLEFAVRRDHAVRHAPDGLLTSEASILRYSQMTYDLDGIGVTAMYSHISCVFIACIRVQPVTFAFKHNDNTKLTRFSASMFFAWGFGAFGAGLR